MSARSLIMTLCLAVTLVPVLGGCSKSKDERLGEKMFVGDWEQGTNPQQWRGQVATREYTPGVFHLTINDDGSWQLEVRDQKGNPMSPPQTASGSWDVKSPYVEFTVDNTTFSGDLVDHEPTTLLEVASESAGDSRTYLLVVLANGFRMPFVPATAG